VANTDRDDIQAALAGDDDAFARIVERYEPQVAKLMWRFSRDRTTCEELMQDVFVEAYLSLETYRGRAPFLHWLRRIGTRVGYRFWKRQQRQRRHVPLSDADLPAAPAAPSDPAAAGRVLEVLLSQLKPPERLVLTLQYLEQCSVKEIARRTGWTAGMVKMRAYRARKKLRRIARTGRLLERYEWTS